MLYIQKAVAAGVKVALGSDYVGWSDYSYTAKEFEFLVTNAGMSNMEAIRAGVIMLGLCCWCVHICLEIRKLSVYCVFIRNYILTSRYFFCS